MAWADDMNGRKLSACCNAMSLGTEGHAQVDGRPHDMCWEQLWWTSMMDSIQ